MSSTDYDRIERAIRYLEAHFRDQPSLERVAAHVGLSEFHFQRLFQRWAGISPKRFVQCLTAGYAEQVLRESASLLEATFATGLSSPSRLHGLFVNLRAVTPAEWRARGEGLVIRYGRHDTPFGTALLAATERGICHLSFEGDESAKAIAELQAEWPRAQLRADNAGTKRLIDEIFSREQPGDPLHLWVRGTNFQVQVWTALLRVPAGSLISYGGLASAVGTPAASRAVGSAVANNHIAYLIPCHRVIRQTGAVGQYRWGAERKKAMLAWESSWNRFNEERFMANMGLA